MLTMRKVDVCFRKHQMRSTDFRRGKRIGKNDHLVVWHRPARPNWMSKEVYESMPETITLREIKFTVSKPGRKQQPFVIVTTLFNEEGPQDVSLEEIAELFHFRWNVELDIRSIKTHMNLNHLRCKSPAMVHREFWTTLLAYNAIRTTAARSSWLEGIPPREISFVSCCQYVLSAWDLMLTGSVNIGDAYHLSRLEDIARCNVANRPDRYEPRVKKKRGTDRTNNTAERALRPAVSYRKLSFGTQSASGSRFLERLLSVSETCRQQKRIAYEYLIQGMEANFAGGYAPSLLPEVKEPLSVAA